jgi:ADP-heptose:LPS heptosyltransferase
MAVALISTAGGVGDLVRITPLIAVCHAVGYVIDLLVEADYADASTLVQDLPGVRRVFHERSRWTGAGEVDLTGLEAERYHVAIFTAFTDTRLEISARRHLRYDRHRWLQQGDIACVQEAATALGWRAPLPPPAVCKSSRRFDLVPGTLAIHPGCKPTWPWKKWHGFAHLARRFAHVVLVGTRSDLENAGTYFAVPFEWPSHVRSFIGQLSLSDTASLLSECAALVSTDSGLMHVGVALGIPTFGIFGITSPLREALPRANMLPVTKGLACEPACHSGAWGRRDCQFHLECLRSLTADDVAARVEATLPALVRLSPL